mmetsp:Transcript_44528/g.139673  ORF Transcript_44528/g.139673 Transcript_44528/m.139673 type:complete len:213 (+) Transcript_44528:260-898(+)
MSATCACSMGSVPSRMPATARNSGSSKPCWSAKCTATAAVGTPSTVISLQMSSRRSPFARRTPVVRLRLSEPNAVSMRSPTPLRPLTVAGSPPMAMVSFCSSSCAFVTYAAIVLMPRPRPSIMPAPMASGFLRAPPSWTPTTSVVLYTRNHRLDSKRWMRSALSNSVQATTTAVGCCVIISLAKDGPERYATHWSRPMASAMASPRSAFVGR